MSVQINNTNANDLFEKCEHTMEQTPEHMLSFPWCLYYHLPEDKNWTLASYITVMDRINTVEKMVTVTHQLSDNIIKYCMLFLMKQGVTPMWEDAKKSQWWGIFL